MINVLSLILLNIIYFMCNSYPKHIFEINSPFSVLAITFNSLFYIIFALFLVISINKNKNIFSKDIFSPFEKFDRKIELRRILLVCVAQIFFDIIILLLNFILNKNIIYVSDFTTVLVWIIIYNICATKENNLFRRNKSFIVVIVFIVLMIVTTCINHNILEEYLLTINKYNLNSAQAEEAINNFDFLFGVKNFFLDTISGLVLLAAHGIFNKSDIVKEQHKIIKQVIRSFVLVVFTLLLVGIKTLIFPYSCIKGIDIKVSDTQNNSFFNQFSAATKTTTVKRIDSNFSEKNVFQNTSNKLFYNGILILEYVSNDNIKANTYKKIGNKMIVKDCFEKYVDNGVEFYLYKNEVICFLNDSTPVAVYCSNKHNNYYERLTAIYKILIENNNWNFFKQGAEYMLKYDEKFIEPYLERYSSGEFEKEELETMDEMSINKSYIQCISNELSKNI